VRMGDEREPATNWHDEAFFGIYYDLHANADDTELGRELTVEHVTIRLRRPEPPRSVIAIPFDRPLDWTHAAGIGTNKVPRVDIHTVVVVE